YKENTLNNATDDSSSNVNFNKYTNNSEGKAKFDEKLKESFGESMSPFDESIITGSTAQIQEITPPSDISITDVALDKDDFNKEILDYILGGSSLVFELINGDLESIKQSLDFLTAFLDNANNVKDLFGDEYKTGSAYDSNIHNNFIAFQNAIKNNKDIDLTFLSNYKTLLDEYNNNKELYESGSLHPDNQTALKKILQEQYAKLLGMEKQANSMLSIFKNLASNKINLDQDYKIFTNNTSVLRFNVGIGKLVKFEDTNGGGDDNNNFTPSNDLAKQIDLASKEPVLILPAEEEKVDIQENSKERVRLCIVSD
ncbi:hypothetical protein IO476_001791, partial [Campylobacter coli]|nr:hypothetical protein [Campylobacter coli]